MAGFRLDRITSLFQSSRAARPAGTEQTNASPPAQEATPAAAPPESRPETLFVQSFHSGSLTPSENHPDRLTITLEHGLGQTIVFSGRPERSVSALPTENVLNGLGFPPDNPPNAAMILETAPGDEEITVVELFDPVYDVDSSTLTYDISILQNWRDSADFGFTPSTLDAANLPTTFGAAHLFIDDCVQGDILCIRSYDTERVGSFQNNDEEYIGGWTFSDALQACIPMRYTPGTSTTQIVVDYAVLCNRLFSDCLERCEVAGPAPYFNYLRTSPEDSVN